MASMELVIHLNLGKEGGSFSVYNVIYCTCSGFLLLEDFIVVE